MWLAAVYGTVVPTGATEEGNHDDDHHGRFDLADIDTWVDEARAGRPPQTVVVRRFAIDTPLSGMMRR